MNLKQTSTSPTSISPASSTTSAIDSATASATATATSTATREEGGGGSSFHLDPDDWECDEDDLVETAEDSRFLDEVDAQQQQQQQQVCVFACLCDSMCV